MKFLNSKVFTTLVLILALWLTLSSVKLASQRAVVDKAVNGVQAKIKEVQADTDYLNKFLSYFKTSAFLEKEARLKLNYKAQGEEVVFIYKDKNIKSAAETINLEELLTKMPNYKKWFLYVIGY